MADPGSLEQGWGVLETYGARRDPTETTGFDLGTVSGMGGGGIAQRLGELNARERARQMDIEIGKQMSRTSLRNPLAGPVSNQERIGLLANQALRTGAQFFSPRSPVGAFRNPFGTSMPKSVLDQMWKTSTGQKMVPIFHGGSVNLKDVGWNPSQSPRYKGGWTVPEWGTTNKGWLAHATHAPQTAEIFKYGTDQTGAIYHGDVPLSEYRKGFQWSPIFKEPEIRMTGDDWNKAFEMAEYKDNPLAKLSAKTVHTPGRFARAVPFAGAALGAVDVGYRAALGDYAGAVLSGIGMIPGPIGWAGLGTQMAYDIIMAGINNGTLETQQEIDSALGITGPPGIRGDY